MVFVALHTLIENHKITRAEGISKISHRTVIRNDVNNRVEHEMGELLFDRTMSMRVLRFSSVERDKDREKARIFVGVYFNRATHNLR